MRVALAAAGGRAAPCPDGQRSASRQIAYADANGVYHGSPSAPARISDACSHRVRTAGIDDYRDRLEPDGAAGRLRSRGDRREAAPARSFTRLRASTAPGRRRAPPARPGWHPGLPAVTATDGATWTRRTRLQRDRVRRRSRRRDAGRFVRPVPARGAVLGRQEGPRWRLRGGPNSFRAFSNSLAVFSNEPSLDQRGWHVFVTNFAKLPFDEAFDVWAICANA